MRGLQLAAVEHRPLMEFRHTDSSGRVVIRLRTAQGDFDRVILRTAGNYGRGDPFTRDKEYPMKVMWRDGTCDTWQTDFLPEDPRIVYCFTLESQGLRFLLDADGIQAFPANPSWVNGFHYAHAYPAGAKPAWSRGCVGYQIFPDRFRRGETSDTEKVEPWNSRHYANEYRFGGNLKGIREAVPYLKELGVGVVYMTPIFLSDTSHRYNTFDYYKIDPLLGTEEELCALTEELHRAGIRIVLDGVFNHCGLGFAPFRDAVKNGKASPYYDWFFFDRKYPCGYMTFGAGWSYMPKLNMQNPECAEYFLEVGRYWLRRAHVDGWRLDVSPEVWPDFWRRFRSEIKKVNPDAVMIAECWNDSREWCVNGDMFDGTMHYLLSEPVWRFFGNRSISLTRFDELINRIMTLYPREVHGAMWTFLSSHDTERMLTRCGRDRKRMIAAAFFQMTYPGVPVVYYGDELGMQGGPDPDCRRPMAWDKTAKNAMLDYYKKLIKARKISRALREGSFRTLEAGKDGVYLYLRETVSECALCLLNTSDRKITKQVGVSACFGNTRKLLDLLSGKEYAVKDGMVSAVLAPGAGIILEEY